MKTKYRIYLYAYKNGFRYGVWVKRWWFPFWCQKDYVHKFEKIEDARRYIKSGFKKRYVKPVEEGEL